jgi:hypothetical protein
MNDDQPLKFHPHDDPGRFLAAIVDSLKDAIIGKDPASSRARLDSTA